MPALPRLLGLLTAAYGLLITVHPRSLARPCGLTDARDEVSPAVRVLVGGIGVRDAAIGGAMLLAPRGPALRAAVAARVVADASDAVVFGTGLPERDRRLRIAGFALGWAALCALSGRWTG
ncbi:MAG TPA: hypothetical protein VM367_18030 [Pseudonocardia sp.]|nr:hypothetical protein [Pseudonocardia sp.]